MLELTGAMRTELRRLADTLNESHAAVRLACDPAGKLRLVPDEPQPTDVVLVQVDNLPPLIAAPHIAEEAEGSILHFHALADERYNGATVVLLQALNGGVRPEWAPPTKTRPATAWSFRGIFRRGPAPASTTQSASL